MEESRKYNRKNIAIMGLISFVLVCTIGVGYVMSKNSNTSIKFVPVETKNKDVEFDDVKVNYDEETGDVYLNLKNVKGATVDLKKVVVKMYDDDNELINSYESILNDKLEKDSSYEITNSLTTDLSKIAKIVADVVEK